MRFLTFAVFMLALSGCAAIREMNGEAKERHARAAEERRLAIEEYNREVKEQYRGWTEDQVLEEFGAPSRIETAGSYKIYYYTIDRGYSGKSSGAIFSNASFGNSRTRRHFEETTFFFKEGRVAKWEYVEQ